MSLREREEFIDKNAILFDEAEARGTGPKEKVEAEFVAEPEESLLEHTACFADFKALVSDLLLCHLMEAPPLCSAASSISCLDWTLSYGGVDHGRAV